MRAEEKKENRNVLLGEITFGFPVAPTFTLIVNTSELLTEPF